MHPISLTVARRRSQLLALWILRALENFPPAPIGKASEHGDMEKEAAWEEEEDISWHNPAAVFVYSQESIGNERLTQIAP